MKTTIDMDAARELELYIENTSSIYHYNTMPVVENLRKKYNKGQYDSEKAVKAWEYVAEAGAKLYHKEFGSGSRWYDTFNAATRRFVAESLEKVYFDEYIAN